MTTPLFLNISFCKNKQTQTEELNKFRQIPNWDGMQQIPKLKHWRNSSYKLFAFSGKSKETGKLKMVSGSPIVSDLYYEEN